MASSEDIEARLCAYIEGDLDAQQRQEIETHLAAHPQHQKMIADLIETRNLLTSLPRAAGPADLGEGLQGQLERSMLLGDDPNEHDHWRVRARRMPRVAAAAAVLLVGVGLAAVIVQLLRVADHPAKIAAIPVAPPIVLSVPATQPVIAVATVAPAATQPAATQPAVEMAATGAPTTQPAGAVEQLASFSAGPATQPSVQSAGQPDGDDMEQTLEDWPAGNSVDDGVYPQ